MPKFIIFNGPPKVGKDTISNEVAAILRISGYQVVQDKFAGTMKAALASWLSLHPDMISHFFEDVALKNDPCPAFLGMSPRQMLISFSEEWVKPKFGKDAFGKLMAVRCASLSDEIIIISDCGFADELKPLLMAFGGSNIALIRLHRQNSNFFNDSRNYIATDDQAEAAKTWAPDEPFETLPNVKFGFESDYENGHTPEALAKNILDDLQDAGFNLQAYPSDDEIPF